MEQSGQKGTPSLVFSLDSPEPQFPNSVFTIQEIITKEAQNKTPEEVWESKSIPLYLRKV